MPPASPQSGPAIVLVADRTLSANYKVLFEGIFATMQTRQTPGFIQRHLMSPKMKVDSAGRAAAAPLGVRRVEAALVAAGVVGRDDIVCTTPEHLPRLLGPWVKIVGVSSSDPLGGGMSNTTTASFCRGELYTRYWTRQMMQTIAAAKKKHGFKVLAGGGGAWQWARDLPQAAADGIDCVFEGYFERQGPALVADALAGRPLPAHVKDEGPSVAAIRPILAPSVMGVVELTRGCGKACQFCASAFRKMEHLPAEIILADLRTNVAGGISAVVNGSEDFFRYGADGHTVNFERLHALLVEMNRIPGLSFMQIDHANVSSLLQFSDEQLREIRRLLNWRNKVQYQWLNIGVESANGLLVAANGPGKIAPFRPEDWEDLVAQAARKAVENGFFPVLSIVLGLPGETPGDVQRTLALVRRFGDGNAAIFPVFHEPLPGVGRKGTAFSTQTMRPDHLELFTACYEINFRTIPRLFWDNQRAGGVSLAKRTLVQVLGKAEVFTWRRTFARIGRQIAKRQDKDS